MLAVNGINLNSYLVAILISVYFHATSTVMTALRIKQSLLQDTAPEEDVQPLDATLLTGEQKALITDEAALRAKLRVEILAQLGGARPHIRPVTQVMLPLVSQGMPVLTRTEMRYLEVIYNKKYGYLQFADILEAYLHSGTGDVDLSDIQAYMETCKNARIPMLVPYSKLTGIAVKHCGSQVTKPMIKEWMGMAVGNKVYEEGCAIINNLLDSGAQYSADDISRWIQMLSPAVTSTKDNARLFSEMVLKLVQSGQKEQGPAGEDRLACPGMKGFIPADSLRAWVALLKNNGYFDLAAPIEMELYAKYFSIADAGVIRETIERACPITGLSDTTKRIELLALLIEKEWYSAGLTKREISDWMVQTADYNMRPDNAHRIPVAAIRKGLVNREDVLRWLQYFYSSGLEKQLLEILRAALDTDVPGLRIQDIETWVQSISPANRVQCMQVVLASRLGKDYAAPAAGTACREAVQGGRNDLLPGLIIPVLETGNSQALAHMYNALSQVYSYQKQPPSDANGIIDMLFTGYANIKHAPRIYLAALAHDQISMVSSDDLARWCDMCVRANDPLAALEMAFASADAGVQVPRERLVAWMSACFNDKTAEEVMNNAVAVLRLLRNRKAYAADETMVPAAERAFRLVVQDTLAQGETASITSAMPLAEVLQKVDAVLFGTQGTTELREAVS